MQHQRRAVAYVALLGLVLALASPVSVGAPAGAAEPTLASGTFRALTYNVAGLPEGLSGSNPSVNTPLISPLLNDYDLVLVQEDWANPDPPIPGLEVFHEVLISQVTHPYLSEPAPAPLGTDPRRPTALVSDGLNRMSRFPFGALTRVMWPSCFGGADTSDGGAGDCLSQKGFSVASTELAPGIEADVYNLHGEAGSTPLDEQYSAEDFAVLAAYITEHSAGRAVIVGGDFNLHTDRPVDGAIFAGFLTTTGLTDVCAVVDCGADRDEIDKFVFRSGGGVTLAPLAHHFERETFQRDDGTPLSDHDALLVAFGWTEQARGAIEGSVADSTGAPLAGVSITAYGVADQWLGSAVAVTATDGSYVLPGLVPGEYRLLFTAPLGSGRSAEWFDDSRKRVSAAVVVVSEGATAAGVDARLGGGGSITGSLAGPDGPVVGAAVWAYDPADRWIGSALALTAADGSYRLADLAPSEYRLVFVPPAGVGLRTEWFTDSARRSTATAVVVADGSAVTGIDAVLATA